MLALLLGVLVLVLVMLVLAERVGSAGISVSSAGIRLIVGISVLVMLAIW